MTNNMFEDYYQLLGISRSASIDEIKKARRALSKKYHPDLQSDEKLKEEYGAILARINNAADVLLNPQKKAAYDRQYEEYMRKQQARGQSTSQQKSSSYEDYWRRYDYNGTAGTKNNENRGNAYTSQKKTTSNENRGNANTSQKKTTSNESGRNANTSQKKTTSNENRRSTNTSQQNQSSDSSFFSDVKSAYQEILKEEKADRKNARYAHKNVDDYVDEKFDNRDSIPEEIAYRISKGTLHVFVSAIRELSKVSYITKDSIPKFIIRTRRGIATFAAFVVLVTGIASLGNNDITPTIDQPIISTSDNNGTNDATGVFEEEEDQTITVTRYHKIQPEEFLSTIAQKYGVSQSQIQKDNNITNPDHIEWGQTIKINFTYNLADVDYFTTTISVETGTTVKEIAEQYNTDSSTIIALNEEAIVTAGDKYYIISDTIKVPTFVTPKQASQSREYTMHQ